MATHHPRHLRTFAHRIYEPRDGVSVGAAASTVRRSGPLHPVPGGRGQASAASTLAMTAVSLGEVSSAADAASRQLCRTMAR